MLSPTTLVIKAIAARKSPGGWRRFQRDRWVQRPSTFLLIKKPKEPAITEAMKQMAHSLQAAMPLEQMAIPVEQILRGLGDRSEAMASAL